MTGAEITERVERFMDLIGIPADASWLRPPATDAEIEATQAALGHELPADLIELLRIHNGGRLFDPHEWIGASKGRANGIAAWRQVSQELITGQLRPAGQLDLVPGPRTLCVASSDQVEILYDLDDEPGRLLYLDVLCMPAVIPLARNLATLLDCYLALVQDGHLTLDPPNSPHLSGPVDELCDEFATHHVAGALYVGGEPWLLRPESTNFSID